MTGFLDNLREYLSELKDHELKKVISDIPINEIIEVLNSVVE